MANYAFIGPDGQVVSGSAPAPQANTLFTAAVNAATAATPDASLVSSFDVDQMQPFTSIFNPDLSFPDIFAGFNPFGQSDKPPNPPSDIGKWLIYGGVAIVVVMALRRN